MERDFGWQHDRVDNILLLLGQRADRFLDERLQFTNLLQLLRSEKLRTDFEREVVGDTSHEIEKQVSEVIDWVVAKNSALWRDITEFLQSRAGKERELIGHIPNSSLISHRETLLKSVGKSAKDVVSSTVICFSSDSKGYNKEKEAEVLSQEIRQAILQTIAVEVGALGIGGLLATSLLDVSGIVGVGVLAATGVAILPYKRATLKKATENQVTALRTRLKETLHSHFSRDLTQALQHLRDATGPYSRFVRAEQTKLRSAQERLQQRVHRLIQLREEMKEVFP